jgi:undecaprenyl-diphosphatase
MHSIILNYLNNLTGKSMLFDALVIVAARYFQYIVIAYALILMYRTWTRRDMDVNPHLYLDKAISQAVWVSTSVLLAFSISGIMKLYFAIPRPFLDGINPLFTYGGYNSFPSGHATIFAALTVSMFLFHRVRGWWFLASALVIGGARVVAGVHYPIDVAVGYIVGAFSAWLVCIYIRPKVGKYFNIFDY